MDWWSPGSGSGQRLYENTDQLPWSLRRRWTLFSPAVNVLLGEFVGDAPNAGTLHGCIWLR